MTLCWAKIGKYGELAKWFRKNSFVRKTDRKNKKIKPENFGKRTFSFTHVLASPSTSLFSNWNELEYTFSPWKRKQQHLPQPRHKKIVFFHSQMTLKIFLVQREILKQWTLIIVFSKNGKYSKILCQISRSTPRTESFSAKLKAFERNEQITPRPVLSEISQNDFRKTFLEHPWTTSSGRFSKNRALTIRYEREIQKLRVAFGKSQNSNFLITLSENYLEITILPKKVNFLQKSRG